MLANQSNGSYTPVPEGQHLAYCFAVIGLGVQTGTFQGKEKKQPKAKLMFVLPQLLEERDGKKEPRLISKNYTLSLDDRATLFKHLKSWRAKGMSAEERKTYDLDERCGQPAMLTIVHAEGEKGKFATIEAIGPVPQFMVDAGALPPNPMKEVKYDISQGKNATFMALPQRVQEAILKSEEFTKGNQPGQETGKTDDNIPY